MGNKVELPHNFVPRDYQLGVWDYFVNSNRPGRRGVWVCHRRAGKDATAINICAVEALTKRVGTYWHVFPTYNQARAVIWNGITGGGTKFLDFFPKDLIASVNGTEMRVTFKNGSVYKLVGADNKDSLVGTNPVGVVFSEYALIDKEVFNYIEPILIENGGWALFISTPRGKNDLYEKFNYAKSHPDWFCELLSIRDTKREDGRPVIDESYIEGVRSRGTPDEVINSEYYCEWVGSVVGAYYHRQMSDAVADGRITRVPWEPRLPVHTAWDIGVNDMTSIVFAQQHGLEIRLIDYYETHGYGLDHYARVIKDKPYVYGDHYAPHDLAQREWGAGAKSRFEIARGMGIKFTVGKKHDVDEGIAVVRSILPQCWFDEAKCKRLIHCLNEYKAEYSDARDVFATKPLHNFASHGADSFRYLAMGMRRGSLTTQKARQQFAVDNHDYLSFR